MKNIIVGLLLLGWVPMFAQQTVTEKFQKINTSAEAQAFVDANAVLSTATAARAIATFRSMTLSPLKKIGLVADHWSATLETVPMQIHFQHKLR